MNNRKVLLKSQELGHSYKSDRTKNIVKNITKSFGYHLEELRKENR